MSIAYTHFVFVPKSKPDVAKKLTQAALTRARVTLFVGTYDAPPSTAVSCMVYYFTSVLSGRLVVEWSDSAINDFLGFLADGVKRELPICPGEGLYFLVSSRAGELKSKLSEISREQKDVKTTIIVVSSIRHGPALLTFPGAHWYSRDMLTKDADFYFNEAKESSKATIVVTPVDYPPRVYSPSSLKVALCV
eukprot:TRINITY_DN2492_c0_g1_i2.p1 TRINITY_DN2492_c0_g1~~TRINITY_DN2492_c0_g1_i2.p1  ORF type:complete len:192 (+),score=11.50 TRINITY_DN2492_c0_g1_i2:45-620(+)